MLVDSILFDRALEKSLSERRELAQLLNDGSRYYAHQLSDVQLVTEAYRSFASRVRGVKEGLGRFRIPTPPPLPDECPSPTDSEMDMIMSPHRSTPPPPPPPPPPTATALSSHESIGRREKQVLSLFSYVGCIIDRYVSDLAQTAE